MSIRQDLIDTAKKTAKNVRIANIHPTGIFATRALVFVMLVPILLVVSEYIMVFIRGYADDMTVKIINTGINIIDHIFIPSVLTAIVGFLGLWVDRNNNGVPDQLEKEDKR